MKQSAACPFCREPVTIHNIGPHQDPAQIVKCSKCRTELAVVFDDDEKPVLVSSEKVGYGRMEKAHAALRAQKYRTKVRSGHGNKKHA